MLCSVGELCLLHQLLETLRGLRGLTRVAIGEAKCTMKGAQRRRVHI